MPKQREKKRHSGRTKIQQIGNPRAFPSSSSGAFPRDHDPEAVLNTLEYTSFLLEHGDERNVYTGKND